MQGRVEYIIGLQMTLQVDTPVFISQIEPGICRGGMVDCRLGTLRMIEEIMRRCISLDRGAFLPKCFCILSSQKMSSTSKRGSTAMLLLLLLTASQQRAGGASKREAAIDQRERDARMMSL